jgi:hypothetical protein
MISAYKPKFASPFPEADPVPFPLLPAEELPLGGLSEEPPPLSDLWAVGEGAFLAIFSSSFFALAGDLCVGLSLGLAFGVLFSAGVGLVVGLVLGLGVGLGVDFVFGVGFGVTEGLGFGVAEGLGFGVEDGVGFGVDLGVIKFGGGVGVT